MKKLTIILLLLVNSALQATTYNIANQSAFNAFDFSSLVAGDNAFLQRGNIYYGSISITDSGTAGNPITIGAYGTGANPIITGFTTVTAWTNLGDNIWESTSAVSTLSTCNMVAINGNNVRMGRWPNYTEVSGQNRGYLIRVTDAVSDNTIENAALTGTPDWTGAEIVTRTHHTRLDRAIITSQSGSTITFSTIADLGSKSGFFIQNDIRTIDTQNEWYYNPTSKKISVYSTSQPTDVKIPSLDYLCATQGSYITIENITFTGCNGRAIQSLAHSPRYTNLTIQNCSILFTGKEGVYPRDIDYLTVDNCAINDATGIAIFPGGSSNVIITRNDIHNCGVIIGSHYDGGAYSAILTTTGSSYLIQYNNITNTANCGVGFGTTETQIRNNFIDSCSLLLSDGAAITGHSYANSNTVIDGNIVMNGYGAPEGTYDGELGPRYSAGIYTDDNSEDCIISNNTAYSFPWIGIYLKTSDYITVSENTCYNNGTQFMIHTLLDTKTHNIVTGNKFISKTSSQPVINYYNVAAPNFNSIMTASSNVYARPISDATPLKFSQEGGASYRSLADWKTFSGLDANSTGSPKAITSEDELAFIYNADSASQTVTAPWAGIDVYGNQYTTSVVLQPYTSKVLIQNSGTPDYPTVTSATVTPAQVNNSGTVTFSATASEGTIRWWTAATGGSLVTNLSPTIIQSTTYYAEAVSSLGVISQSRTPVTATVLRVGRNAYITSGVWFVEGKVWGK